MTDERTENLRFAVEKAVKPHIADFIQSVCPTLLPRLVDVDPHLLGLTRFQGTGDDEQSLAL